MTNDSLLSPRRHAAVAMALQLKSSPSVVHGLSPGFPITGLIFQAGVPYDAMASLLTPSSHISSVFLLLLSWCLIFCCRTLRKYANLKYLGKPVTNGNYVQRLKLRQWLLLAVEILSSSFIRYNSKSTTLKCYVFYITLCFLGKYILQNYSH